MNSADISNETVNNKTPKSKTKKALQIFFAVFSVCLLVVSLTLCGFLLYHHYYYDVFWVSGQSMYPTLNKDAKNPDGSLLGSNPATLTAGMYDIDYGFMDTHESAVDDLQRFDIIVCKQHDTDILQIIKRVIALPGETFYVTSSTDPDLNGDLYILNNETSLFEYVEQPIDSYFVCNGKYPATTSSEDRALTLGENEYYVMGDNRLAGNSFDSREFGTVIKTNIIGKAVGLEGKCSIGLQDNGTLAPTSINRFWPRFF